MAHHSSDDETNREFTPFAMIPVWLLRSGKKLSGNAIHLYGVIMSYADNVTKVAFPSRETLAEDMGVSINTVKRAIKELEDSKVIHVKRVRTERGGNFRSNQYTLAQDPPWATSEPRSEDSESPQATEGPRPRATYEPPPWATDGPITRPTLTKPTSSKNPPVREVPLSSVAKLFAVEDEGEEVVEEAPTASRRLHDADEKRKGDPDTFKMLRKALGRAS